MSDVGCCCCILGLSSTSACSLQVCGANNQALHDPNRPTFGQLAPLLHAFIAGGGVTSGSGGHQPAPPLVVGHNAPFDARMLIAEWGRRDLPVPREWR